MLPCITLHCWKGEVSLSAFPPPPCQHWISVVCQVTLPLSNHRDRYRPVHVIPGSWSTVFVPLPPPICRRNFLGTYTMRQTQKLIWLKNNFFHWATSSVTSVHWPVTTLDTQLCRSQEVARTNGPRWLLPRRCVQDYSLKLSFIKIVITKNVKHIKKLTAIFQPPFSQWSSLTAL